MENKEKCDCDKMATWLYMPNYLDNANPYHCEECVPRGCYCNWNTVKDMDNFQPSEFHADNTPTDEDKPWKWIITPKDHHYGEIKEAEIWVHLDEKEREYPCAEYAENKMGFDKELYNEDEFER